MPLCVWLVLLAFAPIDRFGLPRWPMRRASGVVITKGEVFRGALLGVSAEVVLFRAEQRATISLRGIPVGGYVQGEAEFGADENDVVIHEPLKGVLSRRFVKILNAHHDVGSDTVHVLARLPLALGTHTIVLARAHESEVS